VFCFQSVELINLIKIHKSKRSNGHKKIPKLLKVDMRLIISKPTLCIIGGYHNLTYLDIMSSKFEMIISKPTCMYNMWALLKNQSNG
jgi:hypothetical protein